MGTQRARCSSHITGILMTFRVAAKNELDPYFAIFLFNDVTSGNEIDQAWSSLLLSLSLLAACTDGLVALLAGRARCVYAKPQKGFTSRLAKIPHRGGCGNLDSTVPSGWLRWKLFEDYVESDTCIATQCDDISLSRQRWFYEGKPVGPTGRLLRDGLYGNGVGNAPHSPFVLAQIELIWGGWTIQESQVHKGRTHGSSVPGTFSGEGKCLASSSKRLDTERRSKGCRQLSRGTIPRIVGK
jgi:hypothetical protein